MDFTFPWPTSQGEWLAWASAVATILVGLIALFAPRLAFRILRLAPAENHPEAIAEARASSGFYLGLGLCCILLGQPLLYMALGFAWMFTAFGRIVGMMSDGANTAVNWLWLVVEAILAALPLVAFFGLVP
jgi:hypothetical protein